MRALPKTLLLPRAGLLVLLCAVGTLASAQQVYEWKDAKGVTHFADNPPEGVKYENRRIDNRGSAVQQAPVAAAAEDPQCTVARKNLELLSGSNPVRQDTNGDGKADTDLDEAGRATQRNLAEASIKAYCKAGPAAR